MSRNGNTKGELWAFSIQRIENRTQLLDLLSEYLTLEADCRARPAKEGRRLCTTDGWHPCIGNYYLIDGHLPVVMPTEREAVVYAEQILEKMKLAYAEYKKRKQAVPEKLEPKVDMELALLDALDKQKQREVEHDN